MGEKVKAGAVILVLAAVIYAGFCFFFQSHYFPGTVIDGLRAGNQTEDEVQEKILKRNSDEAAVVQIDSLSASFSTAGILKVTEVIPGEAAVGRQAWYAWPVEIWRTRTLSVEKNSSCDRELLAEKLAEAGITGYVKEPEEAYLSEYEPGTGYRVIPDQAGYRAEAGDAVSYTAELLEAGQTDIDLTEHCRVTAAVTAADEPLNSLCGLMNGMVNRTLQLTLGDTSVTLDGDTLHLWIVQDGGTPVWDTSRITAYAASLEDTFASELAALHQKNQYQCLIREEELVRLLTEALAGAGGTAVISVPYSETDPGFDPQYGTGYIEVNLSEQTVTLYENGRVVMQSPCVTGLNTSARRTPAGTYHIYAKQRNRTLVGANNAYRSFVNYWMPFNGSIGLHDATWRSSFGGTIWKSNGSHGCVNLPLAFAKSLYAAVSVGETVVVHY